MGAILSVKVVHISFTKNLHVGKIPTGHSVTSFLKTKTFHLPDIHFQC